MTPAHRICRSGAPQAHRRPTPAAWWLHPLALSCLWLSLAACNRDEGNAPPGAQSAAPALETPAAEPVAAPVALNDVNEGDARYRVGITYPPGIDRHRGLAVELMAYAEKARADLDHALEQASTRKDAPFYDLSLTFRLLGETPDLVAVAADGSSFIGGAHSIGLIERFIWLPRRDERLQAKKLITEIQGWEAVSEYAREQLHAELSQRVDADELDPVERARILREAGRMIDAGTRPEAGSFSAFEPVLDPESGKITALRFVFPPYQVGPYTDASTSVEMPAELLLPYIAQPYRALFSTDPSPSPLPLQQDPLRDALGRQAG